MIKITFRYSFYLLSLLVSGLIPFCFLKVIYPTTPAFYLALISFSPVIYWLKSLYTELKHHFWMVKYRREQQTQDFKEFKKFKKRKSLVSPRIEKKDLELKSQDQINQLAQESFDRGFTQGLNKAKKIYSNREKTLKIYESKMKQRLLNYATQVASEKKFEIENSQPKDEKKWH